MSTTKVQSDMVDIDGATTATIVAGDKINFLDITDSLVKEDTVQGILDLVPSGGGKILQIVNTLIQATATGTTTTPDDDTIPQKTEGNEIITRAITPAASDNNLLIIFNSSFDHSANGELTLHLHQDSTANAIASCGNRITSADHQILTLHYYMAAGTTSSTTFKIRCGQGSSGTLTWPGQNDAGGTGTASLTVMEID